MITKETNGCIINMGPCEMTCLMRVRLIKKMTDTYFFNCHPKLGSAENITI